MAIGDKKYDVIVVGAGLIGASFALQLAQRTEYKIAVIERADAIADNNQPNQRVVALGQTACALLSEVGVFQMLKKAACYPYHEMFIWDQNSNGVLTFSARDHGHALLGHIVDANQCSWLLQQTMASTDNIDIHYGFAAESLQLSDRCSQIASAEQSLTAQLVVAADGNRSWVRRQAKIFADQRDYQQLGIVVKITTEESHQDTAYQRFLASGPLAVLPLADNQSSIVWSVDTRTAEKLLALPDEELATAIANALEQHLGKVTLLSKPLAFPLKSQAAQQYFKRGVVLIGDAAHSIHPLAGQGANLGFKDVTTLVEILESCDPINFGSLATLQRYQRARQPDNQQTDQMMGALYGAYRRNGPWWLMARGAGMNWVNASLPIKALLVKQAMGL